MTLTLITPPAAPVVGVDSLCAQLRVTSAAERTLIEDYARAAVAWLDGWTGVLGRCMMQQVWRQEFTGFGTLRLALPDVASVEVTAEDADGNAVVPTRQDLRADVAGPYVLAEGPDAARVFVDMTCAMSATRLPVAQQIVRLIVAHWFENRAETVVGASVAEIPLGAAALIDSIRWSNC